MPRGENRNAPGFCRWGRAGLHYGPARNSSEDEKTFLQGEVEILKAELAAVEKRLTAMDKK